MRRRVSKVTAPQHVRQKVYAWTLKVKSKVLIIIQALRAPLEVVLSKSLYTVLSKQCQVHVRGSLQFPLPRVHTKVLLTIPDFTRQYCCTEQLLPSIKPRLSSDNIPEPFFLNANTISTYICAHHILWHLAVIKIDLMSNNHTLIHVQTIAQS